SDDRPFSGSRLDPSPYNDPTFMIYDFSCSAQLRSFEHVFQALSHSGAVLSVLAGLSALGASIQRRSEFHATDIFIGWGIVAAFMTLVAVAFTHALMWAAIILAVLMVGAIWHVAKRGYFIAPFWLLALFPGVVILAAINLAGISGWDDFSHWVPNALYLFHNDDVPSHAIPSHNSVWPSYPYAIPFLTYLASLLAGGFLMQGGAMFNFMLLLAFADMLAQTALPKCNAEPSTRNTSLDLPTIGLTGLAFVLTTLANPSFNASFTITNEGDTSTMILVGVLGLLLWELIDTLKRDNFA